MLTSQLCCLYIANGIVIIVKHVITCPMLLTNLYFECFTDHCQRSNNMCCFINNIISGCGVVCGWGLFGRCSTE